MLIITRSKNKTSTKKTKVDFKELDIEFIPSDITERKICKEQPCGECKPNQTNELLEDSFQTIACNGCLSIISYVPTDGSKPGKTKAAKGGIKTKDDVIKRIEKNKTTKEAKKASKKKKLITIEGQGELFNG